MFSIKTGKRAILLMPLFFAMSSCNQAGVPIVGLQQMEDPVPLAQNDPTRKAAVRKLAIKLDEQKRVLKSSEQPLNVASLRPAKPEVPNSMLANSTVGVPADLDQSDIITGSIQKPQDVLATPDIKSSRRKIGPLANFHSKLAGLESGQRTKPITILHIGDSHVASDSFSRGIRDVLQTRYGDAGRGMVIPARAYKWGVADQVEFSSRGNWRSETALKRKKGRFGISGVSVSSRSSRSSMKLTSKNGEFDWASVTVATGPSQGAFKIKIGEMVKQFEARAEKKGSKTFRVDARGNTLEVIPGGGAQTTVFNWSTGKNVPGIRYVNFGLIGATVDVTKRFDRNLVANDIRRLDPDLIIYGYGTNEGFNDRLQLDVYQSRAAKYVNLLRANAPNAEVVYIGAASGLRRKGRRACGRWAVPPNLGRIRTRVRRLAGSQNAAYWDWSRAMGGVCAINSWARRGLAAKDRVHLTSKGYRRSANAFAKWLMSPKASNVDVASN